jgi:hypothetical protein
VPGVVAHDWVSFQQRFGSETNIDVIGKLFWLWVLRSSGDGGPCAPSSGGGAVVAVHVLLVVVGFVVDAHGHGGWSPTTVPDLPRVARRVVKRRGGGRL